MLIEVKSSINYINKQIDLFKKIYLQHKIKKK